MLSKKRHSLSVLIILIIVGVVFFPIEAKVALTAAKDEKPNVLLITVDTLRPDRVSIYSDKHLKTPNIDSLAVSGVVFDRAFAHVPITLPSHASIFLGLNPPSHGVRDNARFRVGSELTTLAEVLKISGYSTGAFVGAFPLDSRFGLNQGFDYYDDLFPAQPFLPFTFSERRAEMVINSAINWLKQQKPPWFCWLHLWDPHSPYLPPEPYLSRFKEDPYSGEVAYVDDQLGRLFAVLSDYKMFKNTLIIFTADHGESLGEHGELTHSFFIYNSTLWVPLIITGPGIKPGRVKEFVSHIDLFPTICDWLKIKKPDNLEGTSLLPLIQKRKLTSRPIYIESLDPFLNRGCAPLYGLIFEEQKFINSPLPELYDLKTDFEEKKNLANQRDIQPYQKKLRELMAKMSEAILPPTKRPVDLATLRRLQSLGYLVSTQGPTKKSFGPEDDPKNFLVIQQKLEKAIIFHDLGRKAEAIELLEQVIAQKKNFAAASIYLAHIYYSLNRSEEALKVLAEAFKANPTDFSLASAYGLFLVKERRYQEAIKILEPAILLYEDDPETWDQLGIAYWRLGEFDKAQKAYEKALSIDPNHALVLSNLGALYLTRYFQNKDQRQLEVAISYFERASTLDPRLNLAFRGLGVSYKLSGQPEKAVEAWKKAIEADPTDDFSFLNLGTTLLEMGEKEKALPYFENYLKLKEKDLNQAERQKIEGLIRQCRKKE
ncbi:MAG: sulfatase-like hydrolase/transferase [Candidatus Aminicenantes bacterium]|nr:sulfatase-like hydrolase/transferase [Candidatus Aminicenantes bacterium]